MVTLVIGLAMVGGEFLVVARFLDWAEMCLRELAHFVGGVWRSSAIGKALIVLVVLILVAAFGYVIYSVFFGGLKIPTERLRAANCVLSHTYGAQMPDKVVMVKYSRPKPVIISALAPWSGRLWLRT
jgi:hypothetical protein